MFVIPLVDVAAYSIPRCPDSGQGGDTPPRAAPDFPIAISLIIARKPFLDGFTAAGDHIAIQTKGAVSIFIQQTIHSIDPGSYQTGFFTRNSRSLKQSGAKELAVGKLVIQGEASAAIPWLVLGQIHAQIQRSIPAAAVSPDAHRRKITHIDLVSGAENDRGVGGHVTVAVGQTSVPRFVIGTGQHHLIQGTGIGPDFLIYLVEAVGSL